MNNLVTGVLLFACVGVFGQKHNLSLNLETGKTYNQIINSNVEIIQKVAGQEIPVRIAVTGKLTYTVKKFSENNYEIDAQYVDIGMKMNAAGTIMEFGSSIVATDTLTSIMQKMMKALTGTPFQMVMSKQGRILEVTGIEKMLDAMVNQFPALPMEQREQIKNQMGQSFGNNSLRSNIEMATAMFPDKTVSIGESWTIDVKNETSMTLNTSTKYTLVEVTKTHYIVKGEGTAQTDASTPTESNGMNMNFDLKGTVISELNISKKDGWLSSGTIKQNLSGKATIASNDRMPGGMTLDMTMISENKISDQ